MKEKILKKIWPYKIRIIISLLMIVITLMISFYKAKTIDGLSDQTFYKRWDESGYFGQITVLFDEDLNVTPSNIREYKYNMEQALTKNSIEAEEGKENYIDCYSAIGSVSVTRDKKSVNASALGVAGDFFLFHPLKLVSGSYFSDDNAMKDQVVIDDELAWQLYGSNDIIGKTVTIGGVPHYICGVIEKDDDKISTAAGLDKTMIIMSYQSLVLYGSIGEDKTSTTNTTTTTSSNTSARIDFLDKEYLYASADGLNAADIRDIFIAKNDIEMAGSFDFKDLYLVSLDNGNTVSATDSANTNTQSATDSANTDTTDSANTDTNTDTGSVTDTIGNSADSNENVSTTSSALTNSSSYTTSITTTEPGEASQAQVQSTDVSNEGGINCYEILMPNPVDNFASSLVRENLGVDSNMMKVIDNTSRFSALSLYKVFISFPTRTMQSSSYRYPYWENIARGYEDILSIYFMLEALILVSLFVIVFSIAISLYNHRTWRSYDIYLKLKDKIYELQVNKKKKGRKNDEKEKIRI